MEKKQVLGIPHEQLDDRTNAWVGLDTDDAAGGMEDERDPGVLLRETKVSGAARDPELRQDDESPSDLQRVGRGRIQGG